MIIPALLQIAFSSQRLLVAQTSEGYQLVVRYFGFNLVLCQITNADVKAAQRAALAPVS